MKIYLTETQIKKIRDKLIYEKILDDIVFKLSLIVEDEKTEPDMEWDIEQIKNDLDQSKSWVKTKNDAIEYLKTLKEKIKNLPSVTKKRIIKYVIYSFVGLLSLGQIEKHFEQPVKKTVEAEKEMMSVLSKPNPPKEIKTTRIRKSSSDLKNHLKNEESLSLVAYNIGDGAYTIGYGHAIFPYEKENYDFLPTYNKIVPKKTKITNQEAEILLNDDIKDAEKIVNDMLDNWEKEGNRPKLTQGMYDAMVSIAFNMGPRIKKTDFVRAIKNGNFESAKKHILSISEKMFKRYPGLKKRRENEYKMFG